MRICLGAVTALTTPADPAFRRPDEAIRATDLGEDSEPGGCGERV